MILDLQRRLARDQNLAIIALFGPIIVGGIVLAISPPASHFPLIEATRLNKLVIRR